MEQISVKKENNEINSWGSNERFDNLTSSELRDKRNEYERQYLQEVPVKDNCRII